MNLEEAIKRLKPFINDCDNNCPSETCEGCYICYYEVQAIKTIIEALDEKYTKGYQDGFKQAKFDCEMDKLQKEMTVSELAKIIKNDIELDEYCTDCRFYDYCHPQVNEALCSTIEDIIKIAKEKKEVE